MSGWDEGQLFYSDPITGDTGGDNERVIAKKAFLEFLLQYRQDNVFVYRDLLRRHYHLKVFNLEVDLDHLSAFHDDLAERLKAKPGDFLPIFEEAARDAARQILATSTEETEAPDIRPIQVTLTSSERPVSMRHLGSAYMAKLVKISGIIISASATRAKATRLMLQCRSCRSTRPWDVKPGFGGAQLPRTCNREPLSNEEERCPVDPYQIVPDKCTCIDQQTLKLQEAPEDVPTGEMPRHILLAAERYLTDKVIPGTRCTIIGIYTVFSDRKERGTSTVAVRRPYIRVVGLEVDDSGPGRSNTAILPADEENIRAMAHEHDVYDRIVRNVAPSIFGSDDIKKATACLLFGGSTKVLPDGMRLRGDINVLLLGDPGTAKSQMLKFAEQVAPIGVYTSGKGSSAAGLTASVIRDAASREFYLEGGAMVLADGGVVCIDEFDKMREGDRVAIHEAMEQQTISIAKAGITTTLNSRASVLAAANSVFGRWDDTKEADENIEFQSTILSRFDLIFVVKDEHNRERDEHLARHVMGVHLNAEDPQAEGEMDVAFLKKYIQYCRMNCGPRLSPPALEKLKNHFVQIRSEAHRQYVETGKRPAIPITVRQLEALVRISESLAKMKLAPFVSEADVDEAIRLFKVSTMSAAMAGHLSGAEGIADQQAMETLHKIERAIKKAFPIGSRVSEKRILQDLDNKVTSSRCSCCDLLLLL
ncbi:minichromosome maintenance complex component 5 [Salpingoeca rosetta]|uniref:DNA replication licensing factor MCM5 n=1 Tax=Salpingoeca rosetta (strain ATCC 50818 / BSB-021) TaxID=946362 RepID=F2UDZ1_SALR5|nr:minichromosome maintenance complex component 5 [Salpingoeca rosetta]EGD74841.1 minichromosome maintenance complex component 5 [Salpingoeca rosetta]|eukprot:XP_004992486.1 minichromosome maintenance complex component 5 [Salpingoeca rosetta]